MESAAADETLGSRTTQRARPVGPVETNLHESRATIEGRIPVKKAENAINVYAQLGFPDADEMLVKAQMVSEIGEILRKRKWSQQQAAKVLGLTQPKLSKMVRGQFRGICEMKMMDCLIRLGRPVKIVVGPESKSPTNRIEVVAA